MTRFGTRLPPALVTGGAGGIGAAIVRQLADFGHRVAIGYSRGSSRAETLAAELEAAGGEAMAVHCDVSDRAIVDAAFCAIEQRWEAPLVLVNCGGVRHVGSLARFSPEQWDEILSINLTGPFNAMQRALPAMRHTQWGRVVNISSPAGRVPYVGGAGYGASKAGLNHLTRVAALELSRFNITVNCVSPGLVRTDMTETMGEDGLAAALSGQAHPRLVEPAEVASLVSFLVTDEAQMVNGQDIAVDGGGEALGKGPSREVQSTTDAQGSGP